MGVITVRKAGEAIAKTVAKSSLATGTTIPAIQQVPLKEARAVTKEEAPYILPAKASTEVSLMPWRGWFDRYLKEKVLSESQYKTYRNVFFFMPDDIYDLQQSPKPNQKIPISKTDPTLTAMYRHPSPGNAPPASLPEFSNDGSYDDDPFDTGYFKRDTRRRYLSSELGNQNNELVKLSLMDQNDPLVQEEIKKVKAGPLSSPGNKGKFATGPSDFDPTGLRATMSVTWSELEKSLDAHMPNHLPTPVWVGQEASIIQWYQERDLPVPVGGYYMALKVPRERRIARW
jgi:hypothetical protein